MVGWKLLIWKVRGPTRQIDPDEMKEITKGIQERQKERAPEGTAPPSLKAAKKDGKIPAIFVSFGPAELLVTEGAPQLDSFQGLGLQYVKNTSANIFREVSSNNYYILLAGRWFRSKSLSNGTMAVCRWHRACQKTSRRYQKTMRRLES